MNNWEKMRFIVWNSIFFALLSLPAMIISYCWQYIYLGWLWGERNFLKQNKWANRLKTKKEPHAKD